MGKAAVSFQESDRVALNCFRLPCIGVQSPSNRKTRLSIDRRKDREMNPRIRVVVGVLTALAMMLLTFALPRGGAVQNAALVQFPLTVGVWAIFVLLFVKLK